METITWAKDLDTGIESIDTQHKRIVDYINELQAAHVSGGDRAKVAKVIANLIDYTVSHFNFEEKMQADAGYLLVNGHKQVHDRFKVKILEFQALFTEGKDVTAKIHKFLVDWLLHHIKHDDADYVEMVKKHQKKNGTEKQKGWFARFFGR